MIVALAGTVALLSVGWLLRRVIPVRGPLTAIVPAAILGGFIALVLRAFGVLPGSPEVWQDVAYHLFGISFLAIGLTPLGQSKLRKGALWMGMGQWATFSLQAAAGGLIALLIGSLDPGFGFLAPMGLNEGPGQALSIGRLWEADYGFSGAASIGATVASVGFVIAYVGGLFAVRGRTSRVGVVGRFYRVNRGTLLTAGAAVAGYVVLYEAVLHGLGAVAPGLVDLVLGVLFFVALLVGMAARRVLDAVGVSIDGTQTRQVTVVAIDGLTVAILGSLTWAAVSGVIWPLVAVMAGAVAATLGVIAIARRWLDAWRTERSLALFGTVTGTVASGLALLALTDPDLESPVAAELGAMVVVSAPAVVAGIALATATASGAISEAVGVAAFAAAGVLSLGILALTMRRIEEPSPAAPEE
jgi:ESS family glutamate:Na+ symporter